MWKNRPVYPARERATHRVRTPPNDQNTSGPYREESLAALAWRVGCIPHLHHRNPGTRSYTRGSWPKLRTGLLADASRNNRTLRAEQKGYNEVNPPPRVTSTSWSWPSVACRFPTIFSSESRRLQGRTAALRLLLGGGNGGRIPSVWKPEKKKHIK